MLYGYNQGGLVRAREALIIKELSCTAKVPIGDVVVLQRFLLVT
jgi:hypothetical protein